MTAEDIPRLPTMVLTKRILLGLVMSQYDPMGLICPILLILKIKLRDLYGPQVALDWDESLPEDLHCSWVDTITMLLRMGDVVIERTVKPIGAIGAPELIGFADGSLEAYSCAIYIRWQMLKSTPEEPDRFFVRLVCGKARVTPVRGTTVPRSELSGYLILTRLLKVVIASMDDKPFQVTTAVDSQCTISALEKSGGILAPFFASRVSEAAANMSELAEETVVHPVFHVPGTLNPADIPTRANSTPEDVRQGSTWQEGPVFLSLPREEWPMSRDFLDYIPEGELRSPKALFNLMACGEWQSGLGLKLEKIVTEVMLRSNCYSKTVNVTARLIKCLFSGNSDLIKEPLTVRDIQVARLVQFVASMGPTVSAWNAGKLDSLRPYMSRGIVYLSGRCDLTILKLLGVESLPILARDTRLAKLIMWESHCEDHRASATDVLARSRQRAWIVRGRHLAKEVCKSCPKCKLSRRKVAQQLMADVPGHQLRPCPPFSYTSLDFAGPFKARGMGNSRAIIKVWGLVIVCQNTRSIKMYATAGYSTDDFLTAY